MEHAHLFELLLDIVIALGAALTLGLLLARLKQSPIVGYLLAGVLIGPGGFRLLGAASDVRAMADLGVALLLFTIGLELPWRRLRSLGLTGAGAGAAQITMTGAATAAVAGLVGVGGPAQWVLGMAVALSSTAVVFRVLADRAEIDSVPGRASVGILLVQDLAVVPLVLLIPVLAGAGAGVTSTVAGILLRGIGLIAALWLASKTLLPLLLRSAAAVPGRELLVILALTFCLGATWAAHEAGLSPVLGAFVAGILLAETHFAHQIRTEIWPLRAGFLALFFVSIGMLAEPAWIARNALPVLGLVAAIVLGKAIVAGAVVRLFRGSAATALVAGFSLAHIGELSFVVVEVGRDHALVGPDLFRLIVSGSVVTLLLVPYVIAASRPAARILAPVSAALARSRPGGEEAETLSDHVIVVGYGPTGRRVVEALEETGAACLVLELNPRTVRAESKAGRLIEFGDAGEPEFLARSGIAKARALVITVPDAAAVAAIITAARKSRPEIPIIARARYAAHAAGLQAKRPDLLLNEEELMGEHLAAASLRLLDLSPERSRRVEAHEETPRGKD
ncbi:MAG: hypothetical protein GF355_12625 [Candidatus Eisenbacteria bacterium]|nr:hypothetical protein [Candidatus Eisenbacteria bacterium]